MNHTGGGAEINQAVQGLPALAAQLSDRPFCRGERQGNHQDKGGHSRSDEPALGDVGQHFVDIEKFVEPDVGGQVQRAVEEREQAEHPAQADQPVLPSQFPQRRNRQRDQQESQSAIARAVGDRFNRISAELRVQSSPDEVGQRREARQKDHGFEPARHGNQPSDLRLGLHTRVPSHD